MSIRVTQTKQGKRYAARVHLGDGKYKLLPSRSTRKGAKEDEARWALTKNAPQRVMARSFAERYLAEYERKHKRSSYEHSKVGIKEWLKTFGNRSLRSITREESLLWAGENSWAVREPLTMLNAAKREGLIEHNPLAGLAPKSGGRKDKEPLTEADLSRLAGLAEQFHGARFKAFVLFTAYTGMRVGEVFALRWSDINFKTNRVVVKRRLYKGELGLPKSNKSREILLLPEARDALMVLDRSTDWVFMAKRGGQMNQGTLTRYWEKLSAVYGPVTPHELRHFCGHHLYVTKGIEARIVAAQLGHANARLVEDLYGHGSVGALDELERVYQGKVSHLRLAE